MTHFSALSLGEIVTWTPPSQVEFSKLQEAVSAAGIDRKILRDMLPRNAFARAARSLEGRIIRIVEERPEAIDFQLTREYLNEVAHEYFYHKEAVVTLTKKSGDVTCESDSELAVHIKSLIDAEMGKRGAADVTTLVQRVFAKQGGDLVSLRDAGGCYFVPACQLEIVTRVQTLLDRIDGRLNRFQVSGGNEETSKSVAESMTDHFAKMIDEFQASLEVVHADSSKDVLKRRVDRMAEMRFKLGTFRDLLRENAEGIEQALAQSDEKFSEAQGRPNPKTPTPKPTSPVRPSKPLPDQPALSF